MKPASPLSGGLLRNHVRHHGPEDLTIVPMLDVMVILAFFLIFTAVFTHTNVLQVHLPEPGAPAASSAATFELEVIVRRSGLEIAERSTGVLQTIPAKAGAQDVAQLSRHLRQIKASHPDHKAATLLVADDIDYDTIVQVMDAVSVLESASGGTATRTELFPQIALGDAPR